jgi:hypothetical protein
MSTKKSRTTNFISPFSFVAIVGYRIRDPVSGVDKNQVRDVGYYSGSATLVPNKAFISSPLFTGVPNLQSK